MKNQIFAGLGLGLLTGFIIGLSVSEVTGVILGALVSLLAAFFGLREKRGDDTANHFLMGAFGVFCVTGIIFGVITRTHKWLAPDLNSKYEDYKSLEFLSADEAKKIFLSRELGYEFKGDTLVNTKKPVNPDDDPFIHSGKGNDDKMTEIPDSLAFDQIGDFLNSNPDFSRKEFKEFYEYLSSAEVIATPDIRKKIFIQFLELYK